MAAESTGRALGFAQRIPSMRHRLGQPPSSYFMLLWCTCQLKKGFSAHNVPLFNATELPGYSFSMFFTQAAPFVSSFVEALNTAIEKHKPGWGLSRIQRGWISFCIMAILVTNSVCWARFERAGLGRYSLAALSWVFRHSKIPWEMLLTMSVRVVLSRYAINEGSLVEDDTDKRRSKSTTKIGYLHKLKDKATGGFLMGQEIVFLVLVTPKITIPVGFRFYMPDPAMTEWSKNNKALKELHIPAKQRPPKPLKNESYPTKQELALQLLEQFRQDHPDIKIRCIVADALYGTRSFIDKASRIYGGIQVISQLKLDQNVVLANRKMKVEHYFAKHPGISRQIIIRGGKSVSAVIGSARLHVCAHGKKRFVIALKYDGEERYRYLVASDMSWRTIDIVQASTQRWLVEVFHEDWKSYEGWGKLTKHQGEEGSSQSLILSLLTDHCLLLHPEQLARIENNLPACTVGSLQARVKADALLDFIRELVSSEDPNERLSQLGEIIKEIFSLEPSQKHMIGRDLGRLEPTPSLRYKAAMAGQL